LVVIHFLNQKVKSFTPVTFDTFIANTTLSATFFWKMKNASQVPSISLIQVHAIYTPIVTNPEHTLPVNFVQKIAQNLKF
jgi:hypothetical protein